MKNILSLLALFVGAMCSSGVLAAQQNPAANKQPSPAAGATSATATRIPATAATAEDDCGCETQIQPEVIAVVNKLKITSSEIESVVSKQVGELKGQIISARKHELDRQINSKLLAAEAKRRAVSTTALLDTEVVAKVREPTEVEIQSFYDANKARISGEFKDVRTQIIEHLRDVRQSEEARKFAERLRVGANVSILMQNPAPPKTVAERERVFAKINGEAITSADIEDALRANIFSVQEQIYVLRKQTLDLKINDALLQQEATKKGVAAAALLEAEVAAKATPVTESEAQGFYEQNKSRLNGEFPSLKVQIIQYLQSERERAANQAFADWLRREASVEIFLLAPDPPTFTIADDDQPSQGTPNAPVTIVEFTDFQCPSCAQTQPILERLVKEFPGKVRLVVRDFPLEMHADAVKAAQAAEAAREQGKFWEYVGILMSNQSALDTARLKEYATRLSLDRQKFDAALDSGKFADKVQRDLRDGMSLGVNATPTIFVNGRRVAEVSYKTLKTIIEASLNSPATSK